MSDTFVLSYETLKGRPKADQALPLLQKIASLVKPIMRKHGWRLPSLAEFFPDSPNLIGIDINGGEKILLRLRPAWAPDTFYPEEDIVHTMLHERFIQLTHNVHGPHDQQFYKFLDGLEDEYAALKRSGYSGEGFFTPGRRLGTSVSHNVPPHIARLRALQAAEQRQKTGSVLGGGGRLGGGNLASLGLSPRELAVLAADMRAADEKACGSGLLAQQESDKAARDSVRNNAADLADWYDNDEIIILDEPPAGASSSSSSFGFHVEAPRQARPPPMKLSTKPSSLSQPPPLKLASKPTPPGTAWDCPACTLINGENATQCEACLTARPVKKSIVKKPIVKKPTAPQSDGWTCTVCGEDGMEHQFWTCRFCGSVKTESVIG
ncbi:WLM-domain-containing protein [Artomyces pyxidatus]|uniref:WLM-domain-containing protein n=1 Tax=Artomyces pyxidatus TaxID=48021 RepID=A0ACB8SGX8_9AGAM|nr:WLM-domain-containing protein [Artomyces pyxidatus]